MPDPAAAKAKLKLLFLSCGKKDGLIHISHLAHERVDKVTDVLQEGDEVLVRVIDVLSLLDQQRDVTEFQYPGRVFQYVQVAFGHLFPSRARRT